MTQKINQLARDILLDSIAKIKGYEYSREFGLLDLETGEIVTENNNTIAKYLLGQMTSSDDIETFDSIIAVITKLPNYPSLIEGVESRFRDLDIDIPVKPMIYDIGSAEWFRNILNKID
jgi:hypothetical protein